MKSEIVKNFPMVGLTIAALLIFFAFFVMTWIRTFARHNRTKFAQLSELPLEEGVRHDKQN